MSVFIASVGVSLYTSVSSGDRLVHRAVDAARLAHGRHLIEVEKSRLARLAALAQQKDRAGVGRTDALFPSSMDVDADSTASHADTDMTSESVSMSSVPEVEVSKETRSEPVIRQDDPSLHRVHRTARSIDVVPEVEAMDMTDEQQQVGGRLGPCGATGTLWGDWDLVGRLGPCGATGTLWGDWDLVGRLGPCGATGTLWGDWDLVGRLGPCGATGTLWGDFMG